MRSFLDHSSKYLTAFVLTVAFWFAPTPTLASNEIPDEPQPGRVIDRVVCKNNPDQSYALYLPSNYSPTGRWALLAAFDPVARGNVPVERFKEAAERYGYIVCGSNNSRNGPLQPSAEAAQSMLVDVAARFSIDDRRVYLTGFSGGARAATAIAVWLKEKVAGVIGCGAGLAAGIEPSSSLPFVFYGTVGAEDFNYPEMKQLDRKLQSAGIAHRIEVFEGGHGWAPPDSCVRALEWMELQAMKSGRRTRDDRFIDRLYKSAQDNAAKEESAGRVLDAYIGYVGIAADFKGLRDVAEFEKKAVLLKDLKAVKQAIKKAQDQENDEIRRALELTGLRARLATPERGSQTSGSTSGTDERQVTFSDLKNKLKELKRKSEAAEATPERAYARRVLNQYSATSFEQSMMLLQAKKYDLAVSNLAIDTELMPDNWRLLYNLACAYSLKGDKRRAIEALTKAVEKGFANASELERNDQLDGIREEAGFKKLVEGLKQKR
jgi:predicted esterase